MKKQDNGVGSSQGKGPGDISLHRKHFKDMGIHAVVESKSDMKQGDLSIKRRQQNTLQ